MKKIKIKFPIDKAESFSDYAYANEIRIAISWQTGGEFFDTVKLNCICHATEEKANALLTSEWKQFVHA